MRRIWPIFGALRATKSAIQKDFGRKESRLPEAQFSSQIVTQRDGLRVKNITIGWFRKSSQLSMGNSGYPDAIRIARVLSADGLGGEEEVLFFLESGWLHIYPGKVPGKLFYSPHLQTAYNQRDVYPAWLDWMIKIGTAFRLRTYTAWMDDNEVYKANHGRIGDALNNAYAHDGRMGKFARCCLGSKFDTSLFLGLLRGGNTYLLSYFIFVDRNLDYWLIKVTTTGVWRSKILFHALGDQLHELMKKLIGPGQRIDQTSAAHADLRKNEAYLFAAARTGFAFEQIDTIDIEGQSLAYGWVANWAGLEASIVTSEQENVVGSSLDGLRHRRYELTISDTAPPTAGLLVEAESELGTPGIEDITLYVPDGSTLPGRMVAWYPKGLTQTYNAELETDIPIHAWYKEDDTLCEVWFKHDIDVNKPEVNFAIYTDSDTGTLRYTCGGTTETFSTHPDGGNEYGNGFYTKNSPEQEIDLFEKYTTGTGIYELTWTTSGGGGSGVICLDTGLNGPDVLTTADCNSSFDGSSMSDLCCGSSGRVATLACGEATHRREYFQNRTHILYSVMMFNFGGANSATLIKILYDGWSGYTLGGGYWNDVIISYSAGGAGSGISRMPWNMVGAGGTIFPDLGATNICAGTWIPPSCYLGSNPDSLTPERDASGIDIAVEHYLITSREVITILDNTYHDWDDAGWYENVGVPAFAYPYMDTEIACRAPIENTIYTGDFLAFPSGDVEFLSDMDGMEGHLGILTIPIGRA